MTAVPQAISEIKFELLNQNLQLLANKSLYWPERKTLIIADLHIGKVMHFRKFGYPVPLDSIIENWEKLSNLILNLDVKRCIFLGDLFHSYENNETQTFFNLIKLLNGVEYVLIKGNHDIHSNLYFEKKGVMVVDKLEEDPFILTHEPLPKAAKLYNLAGHIHPAVKLKGKAKAFMRMPCFYFNAFQGILPAFGVFTGSHCISPKKDDHIFAILNDESIIKL